MSPIQQNLLWVALPYASLVLLVAGMIWRWRTDQFGWTSRSSQWNESRILRLASPLFHLGFLMVMGGHVVGLLVPKDVTEMLGVSQHMYHLGYRETISPWLRSVLVLQPRPELMVDVPVSFKLHVIAGFLLLAIWPFTRLVHAVSAPVGYATRPYVVYRSREGATSTARTSRGWTPVRTQGTGNQGLNDVTPSQGA